MKFSQLSQKSQQIIKAWIRLTRFIKELTDMEKRLKSLSYNSLLNKTINKVHDRRISLESTINNSLPATEIKDIKNYTQTKLAKLASPENYCIFKMDNANFKFNKASASYLPMLSTISLEQISDFETGFSVDPFQNSKLLLTEELEQFLERYNSTSYRSQWFSCLYIPHKACSRATKLMTKALADLHKSHGVGLTHQTLVELLERGGAYPYRIAAVKNLDKSMLTNRHKGTGTNTLLESIIDHFQAIEKPELSVQKQQAADYKPSI